MASVIKTLITHWGILRIPIIRLGLVMVTVCLLIGYAYDYQAEQYALLKNVEIGYTDAQHKLQLTKQSQQDVAQYLPKYQHLQAIGFIGEERRNQWVARLHQVATQYQLLTVDYEIAPPTAYQPAFVSNLGNHQMYRSEMTLQWGLLHEGDFIHLLAELREGTSPFMVRECEISVVPDAGINARATNATVINAIEINNQPLPQHLAAKCTIDWLTIQAPLKGNIECVIC